MQAYTSINLGPTTLGGSHGNGPPRTPSTGWRFPATFSRKPSNQLTHALNDTSYTARAIVAFYRTADESGGNNIQASYSIDGEADQDIKVEVTVIGRWR